MLFTEPTFLFAFLPVLLALYHFRLKAEATSPVASGFSRKIAYRNWLLVIASVIFYARGAGAFTSLIVGSIAFNYLAALLVDRWRGQAAGKWVLGVAVGANLASLGVFKYAGFFATNINTLLGLSGIAHFAVPQIVLPIGISFFTFHSISYLVDVHRQDAAAQKGPVKAALYLLLFPQLIAGPIIRYREIADQLSSRVHSTSDAAIGIRRFIVGLAKKMLVANIVAIPADRIFAMPPAELTPAHAWLAVICYTLQIYFDFSGYSDMAIGLGRIFGFRFPENFRYPYIATSMQDFWRRWHITLSAWFRDYLYVPLGGNRVGTRRLFANLMTVFFLCGLWHGASWTFVVWGLLHGAFLIAERVGLGRLLEKAPRPLRHAYVLIVAMVTWVFFRADSLPHAMVMLGAMAGLSPAIPTTFAPSWYLTPELLLALAAGAVGSAPVVPALARLRVQPMYAAAHAALLVLLAASIMLIAARTYNPFIYFRF